MSAAAAPDANHGSNATDDPPSAPLAAPHTITTTSPADATALPPALTPATTTRQSVALGVLSRLWGDHTGLALHGHAVLSDASAPATTIAHALALEIQPTQPDLTASTGSVPSTTTTLTNTLPPTQSAALRALNAPAFHSSPANSKPAKSTSSRTTVTSQPVVVRTYSASRHASRPGSGFSTPRTLAMPSTQPGASALTAGLAARPETHLPTADDFSFSAILRAVDPEIRDAIDAIAEICARSRMSLADEYDAHLPPQGEITGSGPGWAASTGALSSRGRLARISQGWTAAGAAENTLMAVPEASSSSERLAQEGRGASAGRKRSQSAYGSLKSVISGTSSKRRAVDADLFTEPEASGSGSGSDPRQAEQDAKQQPAWTVNAASTPTTHPAITLVSHPTPSHHLSLATSLTTTLSTLSHTDHTTPLTTQPALPDLSDPATTDFHRALPTHTRNTSLLSLPTPRLRSATLASLAAWLPLPWPRPPEVGPSGVGAEMRLREVLGARRAKKDGDVL